MIPLRYDGLWHALKLIFQEEGLKGLYKGYGLHHVSMGIHWTFIALLVPLLNKKMR